MSVKNRIIEALDKSGKTRQALADKLGLGRGAVSDMLNKEGDIDSLKYIEATAELTGYSFDWIRTGNASTAEEQRANYNSELELYRDLLRAKDDLIEQLKENVVMLNQQIAELKTKKV